MKLIAIFSIEELGGEVAQLFKDCQIPVFSELGVKGFKLSEGAGDAGNWFGSHSQPVYSVLNFAFVDDSLAEGLLQSIEVINAGNKNGRPIHAVQLNVEKYV